jgi:hypothetical protein
MNNEYSPNDVVVFITTGEAYKVVEVLDDTYCTIDGLVPSNGVMTNIVSDDEISFAEYTSTCRYSISRMSNMEIVERWERLSEEYNCYPLVGAPTYEDKVYTAVLFKEWQKRRELQRLREGQYIE